MSRECFGMSWRAERAKPARRWLGLLTSAILVALFVAPAPWAGQTQKGGPGQGATSEAERQLCLQFDTNVAPTLAAAASDDDAVDAALEGFMAWLTRVQSAGLFDPKKDPKQGAQTAPGCTPDRIAKGRNALATALKNAMDRAEKRCRNDHEPANGQTMLRRARQATMLGLQEDHPEFDGNAVYERVEKSCLTFRLEMDSTEIMESGGTTFSLHLSGKFLLVPSPGGGKGLTQDSYVCDGKVVEVEIPLEEEYPAWYIEKKRKEGHPLTPTTTRSCVGNLKPNPQDQAYGIRYLGNTVVDYGPVDASPRSPCTASTSPKGTRFDVTLNIMGDLRDPALLLYIVFLYPGPNENIVVSCPGAPTQMRINGLWGKGFIVLHPNEIEAGFTDFKMVKNGSLWAQKTLEDNRVRFVREDLDLRLIHVPQ